MKNMDKLMDYINARPEFNAQVIYSTPSVYLKAINEQKIAYPPKLDDFFPYADNPDGFWTGYFTSRVAIKLFVRQAGRYMQSVRNFLGLLLFSKNEVAVSQEKQILDGL